VVFYRTHGNCAHAYAMSKQRAATFREFMGNVSGFGGGDPAFLKLHGRGTMMESISEDGYFGKRTLWRPCVDVHDLMYTTQAQ